MGELLLGLDEAAPDGENGLAAGPLGLQNLPGDGLNGPLFRGQRVAIFCCIMAARLSDLLIDGHLHQLGHKGPVILGSGGAG